MAPFPKRYEIVARHPESDPGNEPLRIICFQEEEVLQKELAELDAMGFEGEVIESTT